MMHYWDRAYNMMGPAGWWSVFNLAVLLVIVFLAIFLIRYFMKRPETPPSPLEIAKTRLAKGEITPEEFAAIKEQLNQ